MRQAESEPLHEATLPPLGALGMPGRLAEALAAAAGRRAGLVLVAGPSGSGVTTTVRALLGRAEHEGRNPIELPRDEAPGAIHRSDSDVIGSAVESSGTAVAAVDAALDGRMVIASVASGSAVEAIVRIRALGVEPYRLAAALSAAVAQRLVLRLCRNCRVPIQAQGSVSALLGFDPGTVVYAPGGCETCDGTGYAGRIGVFEAVFPDPSLRRLIAGGGDEAILARHAFLKAPNLGAAARALVRDGVTTAEEAVRVSRF
jgi:general secretion pathway protein E